MCARHIPERLRERRISHKGGPAATRTRTTNVYDLRAERSGRNLAAIGLREATTLSADYATFEALPEDETFVVGDASKPLRLISNEETTLALRSDAEALPRWIEPDIEDHVAFLIAHPECEVTAERLIELRSEIVRRAYRIDGRPQVQEDLRAAIELRIVEAATAYRHTDATGAPIYDYLAQRKSYIVQHAAGTVYSAVRRARAAEKRLPMVRIAEVSEDDNDGVVIESIEDPHAAHAVVGGPEYEELTTAINDLLSPAQRRVYALLEVGEEGSDIGRTLGLARGTVHNHMDAIRSAARAVLDRGHGPAPLSSRRISRAKAQDRAARRASDRARAA